MFEPSAALARRGNEAGWLPTLATSDARLKRTYYMSALSLASQWRGEQDIAEHAEFDKSAAAAAVGDATDAAAAERERQELADAAAPTATFADGRAIITAAGSMTPWPIGGAVQFFWDTSLRSVGSALLDPHATRAYLRRVLSAPSALEGSYCIDAVSATEWAARAHLSKAFSQPSHSPFHELPTALPQPSTALRSPPQPFPELPTASTALSTAPHSSSIAGQHATRRAYVHVRR